MSVFNVIYDALVTDPELTALLSQSTLTPATPAIYEEWASKGTEMPYMNLTYLFGEGFHWAKREGTLFIDIFAEDSVQAEAIRDHVWYSLDRQLLESEKDGQVRLYASEDSFLVEEDGVIHWEVQFKLMFWRKHVIQELNEGEL